MKDHVKPEVRWETPENGGRWFPTEEYKHLLIIDCAKTYGLKTFVETGVCEGDTTRAVHDYFDKTYSIELGDYYYNKALVTFKNTNVTMIHGDSSVELKKLLTRIPKEPVLFYLDAHCSGGKTAGGPTPLYAELEAIFDSGFEGVIIIDDMQSYWPDVPKPEDVQKKVSAGWNSEVVNGVMRIWKKGAE